MKSAKSVAIVGTAGVPGNYGGFETLAENLARHHEELAVPLELTIFCSTKNYDVRSEKFHSTSLKYIPLSANGVQSIVYDIWSILSAVWVQKVDTIIVLGVSGTIVLPFLRLLSNVEIITNVDGVEWKREKWNRIAKIFLRFSERIAAKVSHVVIADNKGIADHIRTAYGVESKVIAYGGDHVLLAEPKDISSFDLPKEYVFLVCRIEQENNIELIVSAFTKIKSMSLVLVGNWNSNDYGKRIKEKYASFENIRLIDSIYDLGILRSMREGAVAIVHGHSAGGTNPSLVEGMWFGKPIIAFDCIYNRYTTENEAIFFNDESSLINCLKTSKSSNSEALGDRVFRVASEKYTWSVIAAEYFALLVKPRSSN